MDSEQTLIQQAQKGSHDAFATLVDEHQRYVFNLALRVVKDENEALDLTQETFVRAWTALPNFRVSPSSAPGFIAASPTCATTACPICAVPSTTLVTT